MRFKIDWASLIFGRKFVVFALFYFVFEGNFQVKAPGGLIFGGAYFRNFTVFNSFIPSKHSKAFPRQFQFLINRPPYLNSLIIYVLILSMFFFFAPHVPPTRHYTMYDRNRLQGVFTHVASIYANSLEQKKLFT